MIVYEHEPGSIARDVYSQCGINELSLVSGMLISVKVRENRVRVMNNLQIESTGNKFMEVVVENIYSGPSYKASRYISSAFSKNASTSMPFVMAFEYRWSRLSVVLKKEQ